MLFYSRIIVLIGAYVVDDAGELALAERTLRLDLGPLEEAGEAELVEARVCVGAVVELPQANRAGSFFWRSAPVRRATLFSSFA